MAKIKSVISAALNRLETGQLQVAEYVQFAFLAAGTLKVNENGELYSEVGGGGSSGGAWGEITGTLSDQTDLQTALNAKVNSTLVGASNGVATLDSGGKVPVSQLPNSVMTLEGQWNANTNTPTLADGSGNPGQVYEATVAGTTNFGSGAISFKVGDWAVYGADGKWYKSVNSNEVTSVFGRTGTVVAAANDYSFSQISGVATIGQLPDGISAGKIGTGTVNDTKFGYLSGVTSDIQTQIDSKAASVHTHAISDVTGLQTALGGKQAGAQNLTDISGITVTNDSILQVKAGAITQRTLAQVKSDLALNNVANVDTTNASNISSGTLDDARLSSNIGRLGTAQTWITKQSFQGTTLASALNLAQSGGTASGLAAGDIWYDGSDGKLKSYDTAIRVLVLEDKAQTLSNKTLTNPVINDSNGNTALVFNGIASAANYLTIQNAATGAQTAVHLFSAGSATNIDVHLYGKGTGKVNFQNGTDGTKRVKFDVNGTTGTETEIQFTPTASRTLTVPDASGALVIDSATQTLSNKTLTTPVLGVATATSINKVAITAPATGATLTIADGATLTASANATVSGTNTGDQTITLTGDVTGSGVSSFAATIASNAVTYAKFQNISATNRLLGRATTGAGIVEEITIGTGLSLSGSTLNATATSYSAPTIGSTLISSGATVGTIAGLTLTSPTISTITNTGTLTLPTATTTLVGTGTTDTLTNKTIDGSLNTITNLNASNLSSGTVATERLGSGTANSTTFLRGDNTWAAVAGTGTVTSVALSGGTTGLTVSGSPITASGTITLAGTLAIANGGTGQTTANAAFNALVPSQTSNSGKFLTTDGTNTSWGTPSGASLTNFTESNNTYSSQVGVRLLATNAGSNVDAVIAPKGTGAFYLGSYADGTATGGNNRGAYAVDLQIGAKNMASQVASGTWSLAAGRNSTASGNTSIAMGNLAVASAADSIAMGGTGNQATGANSGAFAGANNVASTNYGIVIGGNSASFSSNADKTVIIGGQSQVGNRAGATFLSNGYQLGSDHTYKAIVSTPLYGQSVNITPVQLTTVGNNQFNGLYNVPVQDKGMLIATYYIIAQKSDGSAHASFVRQVTVGRTSGGNATLVGSVQTIGTDTSNFGTVPVVAITADTSNQCLKITGHSGTTQTVNWYVNVMTTEMKMA